VDVWGFVSSETPGKTMRIAGRIDEGLNASGSGYLAEIHFKVTGMPGQTSNLTPTEEKRYKNALFDDAGNDIVTVIPWSGTSVQVITPVPLHITSFDAAKGSSRKSIYSLA